MLARYEKRLFKSPLSIIQVCQEILADHLTKLTSPKWTKPSLANLAQITQPPEDDGDEDIEVVDMALNLLSAITAESIQGDITPDETSALQSVLSSLTQIISTTKTKALVESARSVAAFIRARLAMSQPESAPLPQTEEAIYKQAMEYITDPLVPVRAQGISILRDLILRKSSAINTDAVLDTLISLLRDEDSYVYLNAIKAMQTLADIHGKQITLK